MASQWRMMWWKLRRHRVAVFSGRCPAGDVPIHLWFASSWPLTVSTARNTDFIFAPPQRVRVFYEGQLVAPFVYGYDYRLDMAKLERVYTSNTQRPEPIRFFCHGDEYQFWGLFRADLHLACPARGDSCFCSEPTGWVETSCPA